MFPELNALIQALREFSVNAIQTSLPEPQSSLLLGILLGIKSNLPWDFRQALVVTGTIHVVVVSGYNISLIAGWIASLDRYAGKKIAFSVMILGVLFYTLLTGAEPPTVRAAIMGVIALGAKVFGRLKDSVYILLLTGVIMVLIDQSVLWSISFQLSFLATLGVLLLSDELRFYFRALPNPLASDLTTTLAAQILVFPLLVFYFGLVSIISPLVNLLVLWTVPLSTILGFVLLLTSFINLSLAQVVSWFVWLPLTIFYQVVKIGAGVPFASLSLPQDNLLLLVGSYLIIIGVSLAIKKSSAPP